MRANIFGRVHFEVHGERYLHMSPCGVFRRVQGTLCAARFAPQSSRMQTEPAYGFPSRLSLSFLCLSYSQLGEVLCIVFHAGFTLPTLHATSPLHTRTYTPASSLPQPLRPPTASSPTAAPAPALSTPSFSSSIKSLSPP
jgi:hypothetical protein